MELAEMVKILGGKQILRMKLRNQLDLIALSRRGVSKLALLNLQKNLSFTSGEMAKLLPVSERTIQRYTRQKRFNAIVSEHILRIAEVAAKGKVVFEDIGKFIAWLNQPNINFENKSPVSFLDSGFGSEMVLNELGRIEHGVYS